MTRMTERRSSWVAGLVIGALVLAAAALVLGSLRRPEVATYVPTTADPKDVGSRLVGPVTYTVDASAERWLYFDFSTGSTVESPGPLDWDLGLRRFNVIANGGPGFPGEGGAIDLGEVDFQSVGQLPANGYQGNAPGRDSANTALRRWYDYGFSSHLLTPKPRVYAIRTADGRYAKLEFLSYYCPGALPGCVTFRYVYDGRGGRDLISADAPPPPAPPPGPR
jgi:hypothetical protein